MMREKKHMCKNGYKRLFPVLAACFLLIAGACGKPGGGEGKESGSGKEPATEKESGAFENTVVTEDVFVTIPGMQGEKVFIYLSDLHLIVESGQIAQDQLENVRARMAWSSHDGVTAADSWPDWVDYLNAKESDGVLFGADVIDFASKANLECLKKDLGRLKTPWLYIRADHDLAPSYLDGVFESESIGWQAELGGWQGEAAGGMSVTKEYADVMTMEFKEFVIVGWNNSTAQLSEAGLKTIKQVFSEGKPVLLLTHVPIMPLEDVSLAEQSRETWGGRVLLWGNRGTDCTYQPNDVTQEFLDMIYDENTPVCEILCGHLHFTWDGSVTEKVCQHVFGAALDRHVGIIHVSGK